MSRFSSVLFAVGFGLFASLTTLVSCGDTGNSIPASSKVDEAKEGTYKIVVSMVGDIVTYNPVITVLGLHQSSASTPLVGFIADSAYSAAIDNKTRLYSKYYLPPLLWEIPLFIQCPFQCCYNSTSTWLIRLCSFCRSFFWRSNFKSNIQFQGVF